MLSGHLLVLLIIRLLLMVSFLPEPMMPKEQETQTSVDEVASQSNRQIDHNNCFSYYLSCKQPCQVFPQSQNPAKYHLEVLLMMATMPVVLHPWYLTAEMSPEEVTSILRERAKACK